MDVFFVMCLDGVLALPLAGTGQQAHHYHYSGENSERVTHVSNYFSSIRAVLSSGPQKRVQTVSWEMVTSSAQILHKEFSSSPCSFVLLPMHRHLQHPMSQQSGVQESTGRIRSNPSAAHKYKQTYPKSEIVHRDNFIISMLINPNKN